MVAVEPKKTKRDDTPRSPEITIVPDAEQFISHVVGESTNIPSEAPPIRIEEHHDAESS